VEWNGAGAMRLVGEDRSEAMDDRTGTEWGCRKGRAWAAPVGIEVGSRVRFGLGMEAIGLGSQWEVG